MKKFIHFVREQGVVGLAVGFILGGAVSTLVSSFVKDIIDPLISIILGATDGLDAATVMLLGSEVRYGNFLSALIDFIVIALVVYYIFKGLKLDKLDKKKEVKK